MDKRQSVIDWLLEVRDNVPRFLDDMRGQQPGFFRYSYSGDIISDSRHWGLNNTVFAIKIYHLVDKLKGMDKNKKRSLKKFLMRFARPDNTFADPVILRRSFPTSLVQAITLRNLSYVTQWPLVTAQTRQAIAALHLLNHTPQIPDCLMPDPQACETYVTTLPWHQPWAAGSHLSHLLFFIHHSSRPNKQRTIARLHQWIITNQRPDGTWHTGRPSPQQRINGAMKVLTALAASDGPPPRIIRPLIDLCLKSAHNDHACDHVDISYVLAYAHRHDPAWRQDEIQAFARHRITHSQRHYYPAQGGFSFYPGRANDRIFGARINRGLPEADIHGTLIFLWMLSLLTPLLFRDDHLLFNNLSGQ